MDDGAGMTCRELVEMVTEYLEGAMDPATEARFREHAGACPECMIHLDQMEFTVRALGGVGRDAITPEAREALMARFRDRPRS